MQKAVSIQGYLVGACLVLLGACGTTTPAHEELPSGGPPETPTAQPPQPAAPTPAAAQPTAAAQAGAASPSSVDDPAFLLRLVEAGPYKAGELGRFVLELAPRGKYHVNQDYPIEIALTSAAETTLPKSKLERADAAEFGEKKARFDVPFMAKTAGSVAVHANVKFAVCTEDNCVPDERNLSLAMAIQ